MKLSEAIRLGAMLKPQAHGDYTARGGTCALGAALEACGRPIETANDDLGWLWPWIGDNLNNRLSCVACRLCWAHGDGIKHVIAHLNDMHLLTREQIAEWVATIEPAETPTEQPVAEAVAV